ncbi:MAG: AAA family ATPase [Lachnospiraceae bacterium]|nr:AAA family ATPase [Lachnospiraceae bacterium]
MKSNRKVATGLQLINWSRFTNVRMKLGGSTLITGNNGTGKSTVLDAITYLITGNTQFNIAAKDRDRSVAAYVRGDTHSEGSNRYLRGNMDVVSYIAMEFYSPIEKSYMVIMVAIELKSDDNRSNSYWYIARDTTLDDIVFCKEEVGKLTVYPKGMIEVHGRHVSGKEFMNMDRGTKQVIQAMGLRCDVKKYKSKIIKMLAFDPQKNVDKFIQECVLDEGEMSSLTELKEQRANYDEIRQAYEDMLESKAVLERIEKCISDYEHVYADYNTRRLMLLYQKWQTILDSIETLKNEKGQKEATLKYLNEQNRNLDKKRDEANRRLEELNNSSDMRDVNNTLKLYDTEISQLTYDCQNLRKDVDDIKELQQWVEEIMAEYAEDSNSFSGMQDVLMRLAVRGETSEKIEAFYAFSEEVKRILEKKQYDKIVIDAKIEDDNNKLKKAYDDKKQLEDNKPVFDEGYINTKELINRELRKLNIKTDVKFFVELIVDICDKKWRRSIETFLGGKRFNIIVDPKYTSQVLNIINNNPSTKGKVIIGDKLEETDIAPGSAAEQLKIVNPTARRYANYLLNGIKLCESVEELHESPKGAIMPNGMLAKSYAVGKMEINRTKLFIGSDAIKIQLEELTKEIQELNNSIASQSNTSKCLKQDIDNLQKKSLKQDEYRFEAVNDLYEKRVRLSKVKTDKESFEKDPNFMAMLGAISEAQNNLKDIEENINDLNQQIGGVKKEIEEKQGTIESKNRSIEPARSEFEGECKLIPELRQPAIDMYNLQKQKKEAAISERTVREWEANLGKSIKHLEDEQIEYCKLNNSDIQTRGVSYIGYYRQQYRDLANVQIEEAKQKLEKQGEKLQSAFVGDFVAELNEAISGARGEIGDINRELKDRPFGNDIYQFEMKERMDSEGKALFFKISNQMQKFLNAQSYLDAVKEDEEGEQDIKDFIDIVLSEDDETEYTDYRKYFTYDMRITNKQSDMEAALSKKQGSASNGEKQTPYFIILAASLLQLYPKDRSSARLAFIDEAFSALSRERIEQMVDYLETNDFQVIYAAPPDKINSIGSHIQTTITLVPKGRQSFAVEGILSDFEE